ncbi:MAG: hypothetical protein R2838_07745 [Caldilineaceae bacterium]
MARSILTLADELAQPHTAYLAPRRPSTWYPYSFLTPLDHQRSPSRPRWRRWPSGRGRGGGGGHPGGPDRLGGFSRGSVPSRPNGRRATPGATADSSSSVAETIWATSAPRAIYR